MKSMALIAALSAAMTMAAQPGWAAHKSHQARSTCAAQNAAEAEQAIRYVTELMVASSACRNTTYAEFALRNRTAIIHYQQAMIRRLRGKAAFDRWNTALANQAAIRQAAIPAVQFCRQSQPMLQRAGALDTTAFRAYVAAQAASLDGQDRKCGR